MFRFEPFLRHLGEIQRAPATIREYRYALASLERYLSTRGIMDDRAVTHNHLAAFVHGLRNRCPNDDHATKVAAMLKTYFRFLVDRGLLLCSPMADWKAKRVYTGHYPVVGQAALGRILDAVGADDPISVRGRAMLELAYSSALRPREIYDMKLRDIDRRRGVVFIDQSKGRKDRLVPVGRQALAWVDRYIAEVRPRYAKGDDNEYVFVSHRNGKKLTKKGTRWAIQEALRRARCAPIKPASLRGSAATALLESGMDVSYIQRLLGHVDIRTTVTYLRIGERALQLRLTESHPRLKWRTRATRRSKRRIPS